MENTSIFRYAARSDVPWAVLGSLLIGLAALAAPVQTYLYGLVFAKLADYLGDASYSAAAFIQDLLRLCGAMVAVAGGRMVLTWLGIIVWLVVGENTLARARLQLFAALVAQNMQWYAQQTDLAGSLTVVYRCVEEIRCGISENLGVLVQTLASVVFLLAAALKALWALTLLVASVVPLMACSSVVFGRFIAHYAKGENAHSARASAVLDWCLLLGDLVRALGGKRQDEKKFGDAVDRSAGAYTRMAWAISGNAAVLKLLGNAVVLAGLAFGRFLVRSGRLGMGGVFTAFSSCLLLASEILSVAEMFAQLNKAQAAAATIAESSVETMVEERLDNGDSDEKGRIEEAPQVLRFDHVSFSYSALTPPSVRDVSTTFRSENIHFVVGESGLGKLTLALLAAGFLEPTAGRILLDNAPLDGRLVCLLELRPLVFARLLIDNLVLGLEPSARARVPEAIRFADLDSFVAELPDGMHTALLPKSLSGGQLQKIGVARAYLHDPPALILDEALGLVNVQSRRQLLGRIRAWRAHRLTIVITHNTTEIEPQDVVVNMAAGQTTSHTVGEAKSITTVSEKTEQATDEAVSIASTEPDEEVDTLAPMGLFAVLRFCFHTAPHKVIVVLGLVAAVVAGVCPPVLSYCFAKMLAQIVALASLTSTPGASVLWPAIAAVVAVAEATLTFISKAFLQTALEAWVVVLRKKALGSINSQDMSFFDRYAAAWLTTLVMNDTRDLRNLVAEFFAGVAGTVTLTVVGVAWAIAMGWRLALVGMAFVPAVWLVTVAYGLLLQRYEARYKDHVAASETFAFDVVAAVRTVRLFQLGPALTSDYTRHIKGVYRAGITRAVAGGFGLALQQFCTASATAAVLFYGTELVAQSKYLQDQMIQVLTLLSFTFASASQIMGLLPDIARGQRAAAGLHILTTMAPSGIETLGFATGPLDVAEDAAQAPLLSVSDVSFAYAATATLPHRPVLRDLSFDVHRGECVAVTGACGSGKLTISALVARLRAVDRGRICYLGNDIGHYNPHWYTLLVQLVAQEPRLFDGKLHENVVYGCNLLQETDLEKTLREVNMFETIQAAGGPDTNVGQGRFSLGQLQRLAVARSLIRHPRLLILDEPTSRLDPHNASLVAQLITLLPAKYPHMAVLVVTHDPRVMQQCSRILMVQNGLVVEDGTYTDLIAKDSAFFRFMS